jgi:hypothetical protein
MIELLFRVMRAIRYECGPAGNPAGETAVAAAVTASFLIVTIADKVGFAKQIGKV